MFDSRPPPCQTRLPCTHHICPLRPCAFRNKPLTHPPCPRVCTAILTCGLHHCTLQCHPKKCPPCTKLNQYTCPCGNMKAGKGQCGITCTMICTAPTNCIHNNEPHMCHPEEIQCPECHMPTNKICLCGKGKVIARCGSKAPVKCSNFCAEIIETCGHTCNKPCHPKGECNTVEGCTHRCSMIHEACGHTCTRKCHVASDPDCGRCLTKVDKSCICGTHTQKLACGDDSPTCDEECAKIERNRILREALEITSVDPDESEETKSILAAVGKCQILTSETKPDDADTESRVKVFSKGRHRPYVAPERPFTIVRSRFNILESVEDS